MNTLHAKSSCCLSKISRFGKRRRVCTACGRTWRIRLKKRGRKRTRGTETMVVRFFQKRLSSLRTVAATRGCGKDAVQLRLQRSLAIYLGKHKSDWLELLDSSHPLILIADAIWYRVRGQRYAIYISLLRPVNSNRAIICPPVITSGHEGIRGWQQALEALPKTLESRIVALVSDGVVSLLSLARGRGWVIQRCHFHLLSAVQNYLTTGHRSRQRPRALFVMHLVQQILSCSDQARLKKLIGGLERVRVQSRSRGLCRVLGGLVNDLLDYHAYMNFPAWHLPTTSNAAESFIQCLRDLMYRSRGFSSLSTLQNWLTGLAIFKKTIRCNGKLSTKLNH